MTMNSLKAKADTSFSAYVILTCKYRTQKYRLNKDSSQTCGIWFIANFKDNLNYDSFLGQQTILTKK